MEFRPCIDIHNGKVKQIVGGSLSEVKHQVKENFVSKQDAVFFAELFVFARASVERYRYAFGRRKSAYTLGHPNRFFIDGRFVYP